MTGNSLPVWFISDQRFPKGRSVGQEEDFGIHPKDKGFQYGDGIFEGIRVYNCAIFKWREHLGRLYDSQIGSKIKVPYSPRELTDIVLELCKTNDPKREGIVKYIRLNVSRGIGGTKEDSYRTGFGIDPRKAPIPTVVIQAEDIILYPKEAYEQGLKLAITEIRKTPWECIPSSSKTMNYMNNILALEEAQSVGAHEAIMLDTLDRVCEGSADNLFFVGYVGENKDKDYFVKTPDPKLLPLLNGITRITLIDLIKKAQKDGMPIHFEESGNIGIESVYGADEIIITGSGAELISGREVGTIENRKLVNGFDHQLVCPGEVFKIFKPLFEKETKKEENYLHIDASSKEIEKYLSKGHYFILK